MEVLVILVCLMAVYLKSCLDEKMQKLQEKLLQLTSQLSLLYVEDEDTTREQYDGIFNLLFKEVKSTVNGEEALKEYRKKQYDLVITDLTMPRMDGITLIGELVKINPLQRIIVMTAHNTNKSLKESINFQVDGFLLKPVSMEKLLHLLYKVCDYIIYKKSSAKNVSKSLSESLDESRAFFVVVLDNFHEIIKKFTSNIKDLIYNAVDEYLCNIGLEDSVIMSEHTDVLLCSIDKNKFQNTLKTLQRFQPCDNYIVLVKQKIKIYISLSYGIISLDYKQDKTDSKTLMGHITNLIHEIKQDENSSSVVKMDINYEESQKNASLNWLSFILEALEKENIVPFYQPIFDAQSLEINSYQILARIKNKTDYILPKYFIDLSRKAGLIEYISKVILEQSCKIFSNNDHHFHIDIIDMRWRDDTIEAYLNHITHQYDVDKNRIILDIRDYNSLKASSAKTKTILRLKKQGYQISLKDYGACNINIEILSILRPDYIKINKILIHRADNDPHLKKAVEFLLEYVNKVGIKSILVGVESQTTINKARTLGFTYLQGFYLAKPRENIFLKNELKAE